MNKAAAFIAATLLAAVPATAQAQINIAVAGPMTGSLALLGIQIRSGAEAAVAEINAAGGLLGEQVVLTTADDTCSADRAEAVANQLAGAGTVLVVGHLCSAAAIAASDVYADENIVQIAPGAPDPRYTEERAGPGIFRLFGREDRQGPAIAELLLDQPAEALVAVIDDRSPYGRRLADSVVDALSEAGRPPDLTETYSVADPDFAGLVADLGAAGIDAVFVGGNAEDVAELRLEMERQGFDPLLVGGDTLADAEYGAIAGEAADGTVFTYQPDPLALAEAAAAVAAIRAAGGSPDGFALYAYAAVEVWSAAVARTETTAFDAISAEIATGTFQTAIGEVSFSPIGDYEGPDWVWYVWSAGDIATYRQ